MPTRIAEVTARTISGLNLTRLLIDFKKKVNWPVISVNNARIYFKNFISLEKEIDNNQFFNYVLYFNIFHFIFLVSTNVGCSIKFET